MTNFPAMLLECLCLLGVLGQVQPVAWTTVDYLIWCSFLGEDFVAAAVVAVAVVAVVGNSVLMKLLIVVLGWPMLVAAACVGGTVCQGGLA